MSPSDLVAPASPRSVDDGDTCHDNEGVPLRIPTPPYSHRPNEAEEAYNAALPESKGNLSESASTHQPHTSLQVAPSPQEAAACHGAEERFPSQPPELGGQVRLAGSILDPDAMMRWEAVTCNSLINALTLPLILI